MIERKGDIWTYFDSHPRSAIVITTNGFVKKNGECVMGRGVALEAKQRYPWLAKSLGAHILLYGNQVFYFSVDDKYLVTFPVKHNWWEQADLILIETSVKRLKELTDEMKWNEVFLVRPGCGNGGLNWKDVKLVLEKSLDDRFIVVEKNFVSC